MTLFGAAAALAAISGGVAYGGARRRARAEARYPPTGRLLDVGGTTVHAHSAGAGPDLVILHGASGNVRDYTMDFLTRLTGRYRVTVFDRPGLGWTGRLPGYGAISDTRAETPREQARLLQSAARLLGIRAPIVLGHSYGGAVALAWALEDASLTPALVLAAPVSNPWPGRLNLLHHINAHPVGGSLSVPLISALAFEGVARAPIAKVFAPQNPPREYFERAGIPLSLRQASLRANARQLTGLKDAVAEMARHYHTITAPVEIVHGTADRIVAAAIHAAPLRAQLPHARLVLLNGIGHMPHHASPEDVIAAIDRAAGRAGLLSGTGSPNPVP